MIFPFDAPENLAVFSCKHVLEKGKPILHISHDEDGYWQFLCGETHGEQDAVVVGLKTVFDHDPSISGVSALSANMCADRKTKDDDWLTNNQ